MLVRLIDREALKCCGDVVYLRCYRVRLGVCLLLLFLIVLKLDGIKKLFIGVMVIVIESRRYEVFICVFLVISLELIKFVV